MRGARPLRLCCRDACLPSSGVCGGAATETERGTRIVRMGTRPRIARDLCAASTSVRADVERVVSCLYMCVYKSGQRGWQSL